MGKVAALLLCEFNYFASAFVAYSFVTCFDFLPGFGIEFHFTLCG